MTALSNEAAAAHDTITRLDIAGRYRHYKGGLYDVTWLAVDASTLLVMVIYQGVDSGLTWTRPAAEWIGGVEVDGAVVPRFERVTDTQAALHRSMRGPS